jgi:hypothetical protein
MTLPMQNPDKDPGSRQWPTYYYPGEVRALRDRDRRRYRRDMIVVAIIVLTFGVLMGIAFDMLLAQKVVSVEFLRPLRVPVIASIVLTLLGGGIWLVFRRRY